MTAHFWVGPAGKIRVWSFKNIYIVGFLVLAGMFAVGLKNQRDAVQGFSTGAISIDQHLTEPLVLDASTVLKVDDAERLMVEQELPFCEATCFSAIFKKHNRYYQVSFDVKNNRQIQALSVEELDEKHVKTELLKKDPEAYIRHYGPPVYL